MSIYLRSTAQCENTLSSHWTKTLRRSRAPTDENHGVTMKTTQPEIRKATREEHKR
jgi:hypothetical protein